MLKISYRIDTDTAFFWLMYKIILDNTDNDKKKTVTLPCIPRIGDWIETRDEKFGDGDGDVKVKYVVFTNGKNKIVAWVTRIE